jgi:hypothetical protein
VSDTEPTAPEATAATLPPEADTATLSPQPETSNLPPDPAAYDSPRAVRAREKGLEAPYIAGGHDPDPAKGLAEERRYLKLLLAMAAVIIASGFVLGAAVALLGPAAGK